MKLKRTNFNMKLEYIEMKLISMEAHSIGYFNLIIA